jgi:hypothetical protein
MPKYEMVEAEVALHIIREGMGVDPDRLTRDEIETVLKAVHYLIDKGHSPEDLINAARFGMRQVWPYTNGQPWDCRDFAKNITKAKLAASRMNRAGRIPVHARDIKRPNHGGD